MPTGNCTEETKSNTKEYLPHVHLTDRQLRESILGSHLCFSLLLFFLPSFVCWLDLQNHSKMTITILKVTARRMKEVSALCTSFLRARKLFPEVSS